MQWKHIAPAGGLAVLLYAGPAWAQSAPEPSAVSDGSQATTPAPQAPSAIPDPSADRPFARLLPNLGHDLVRFPSGGTALVLGIGGALSVVAHNNDNYFTAHAAAGGTDQIFAVGGVLGNGWVQGSIALGTYTMGRLTRRPAAVHLGSDLIRGQILTGLATHGVKLAVRRSRPASEGTAYRGTHSFPSGHSASTWTTATVLWRHLGWRAGVPASLVAAYVSASRLQQNQHYMSDVLFGSALGVAGGYTVTLGHGSRRIGIAPVPVAGGGAVMLSVLPR
ncbi:MAG TPA: phosphatase PAP2 family protein [Vicinamibacterales bacterium]|nr:phosphatase PAP2 family protein [Vicinamibacterales bacterium]